MASTQTARTKDVYFSADVETDGPIPGPFSMLSFALVYCGTYDGDKFEHPKNFNRTFYAELKPISEKFQQEALEVNNLNRETLKKIGASPEDAMKDAFSWVERECGDGSPVLIAYPLSFDWTWLYWYFHSFSERGSPFNHSRCYDLKTAIAVKSRMPISASGRKNIPQFLRSQTTHTHNALDDAKEQAEIFVKAFQWNPK